MTARLAGFLIVAAPFLLLVAGIGVGLWMVRWATE